MRSDLVARLGEAFRRGRRQDGPGYACEGVTGAEKLRLKPPELRQLRPLRVENGNLENEKDSADLPVEGGPAGRDPLCSIAAGDAVVEGGARDDEGLQHSSLLSSDGVVDDERQNRIDLSFFGNRRAEGVTGVTAVTTGTYTRNRLRQLHVTDPFAPVSVGNYARPFAELQAQCPSRVDDGRWRQAIKDCDEFLRFTVRSAAQHGWTASELLRAPTADFEGGLIWSICGDWIVDLDEKLVKFHSGRSFERASVNPRLWSRTNWAGLRAELMEAGLPDLVAARLAHLLLADNLLDYTGITWRRAQAGATTFAFDWAVKALELGWKPVELFGLHPTAPAARFDVKGLAWLLGDRGQVTQIDENAAEITIITGSRLIHRRKRV